MLESILAALRTIKLGVTEVGNQAKPMKYCEKSCTSNQFRADVLTNGQPPQYTANNDAAQTAAGAQKCQVAV